MSDSLNSGRRLPTLSVLDTCTREALADPRDVGTPVDTSLPSQAVHYGIELYYYNQKQPHRSLGYRTPEEVHLPRR